MILNDILFRIKYNIKHKKYFNFIPNFINNSDKFIYKNPRYPPTQRPIRPTGPAIT